MPIWPSNSVDMIARSVLYMVCKFSVVSVSICEATEVPVGLYVLGLVGVAMSRD